MEHDIMTGLTPDKIISALAPGSGINIIWSIFLYIIFILAVITMFMQSDKQSSTTLMMGAVGAMAVIAKLGIFKPNNLGSLVVNVGMFVIPLIVAGLAKNKKSVGPAIMTGILSGIYFFAFWFFAQRGG
jgi:hypothetical protein